MKDVNSNSFEFNSNGFDLGLNKRKVQNVRILGGAPENDERNYGQGWRPRIEITKALGSICKWVMVISFYNI